MIQKLSFVAVAAALVCISGQTPRSEPEDTPSTLEALEVEFEVQSEGIVEEEMQVQSAAKKVMEETVEVEEPRIGAAKKAIELERQYQ